VNEKQKWLIVLSVSILVITIVISYKKNVHNISSGVEGNVILENDFLEDDKIEKSNNSQSYDGDQVQVIKESENQQNNEVQDLYEVGSLIDWVNQIDDVISSKTLDTDLKIKKIFSWLNENNTPNEIRVKLYRALVQLKPIDDIEKIFSLIDKESHLNIKLAGIEALALIGKQLITLGRAEGQLILNLLKGVGQQTQEPTINKKLNSLVAYMEDRLAGNNNELMEIEYLTGKDAYVWDLSAKLGDSGNIKNSLSRLLDDVSVLVDQDKALLNEEHSKLNLAYLDYFANGFGGDVPGYQDMDYFFEKIKPQKIDTLTDDAVFRYRIWLTAYSYSSGRDSNDFNNFIINELKATNSPVATLVLVENGLNVIDQLPLSTREKLVSLLEEDSVAAQGNLSEIVAETVGFLVQ